VLKNQEDTIAAIATPAGVGGVGIVRLSGSAAVPIVAAVMGVDPERLDDRHMYFGRARHEGEAIDEVLYVAMRGPRSFTGEDVAEIHGHGGPANMGRLLRAVVAAGARHAEAGEFTRRAFANGRLDLTRAEAIADIIHASSERALRVAQTQLQGRLGEAVAGIREKAIAVLAEIEAGIDFPDEELSLSERKKLAAETDDAMRQCTELAATFGMGRALRSGIDVALRGEVNAGKSSLFNELIGQERALVADDPGTTRDFVEATVVWSGVQVTLVDTAGERSTESAIEHRGIELGGRRAAQADLELVVVEAGTPFEGELEKRQLLVWSKVDLVEGDSLAGSKPGIATSSTRGVGLEALRQAIVERATGGASEGAEGVVVTSERQRARLVLAAQSLQRASSQIIAGAPPELVAVDLRAALQALAEITGEEVGEDMLDELFSRFCIGK
jgi:tRNA modification GTPase